MMTPPLLEARRLSKHYTVGGLLRPTHIHALNDFSFTLERGRIVALVGESGSGKSTVVKLIARLIEPSSGEILLNGQDVLKHEPRGASQSFRSKIQMVFQDPFGSLNPVRTIGYHLERPLRIHQPVSGKETHSKVHELLHAVGLNPANEFAEKYPHALSGGQRQRVALAHALAANPQIILADEPISMLDVSIRMGILNLMAQLKHEHGIALLYITHDLASARYIGDDIIVMYAGHWVERASSDEVLQHPAHPYTQLLLSAAPNPQAGLAGVADGVRSAPTQAPADKTPARVGCPFATRCPQVMDKCRQAMPEPKQVAPNHWTRCFLYD